MSKLLIHEPTFKEVVYGCHISIAILANQKAEATEDVLQMAYKSLKARCVELSIRRNLLRHKEKVLTVKNTATNFHHKASINESLRILGDNK